MRRFEDEDGRVWDVVLGRESWGSLYALFVPVGSSDEPVRQTLLQAEGYGAARIEIENMTEHELEELLDRSKIKES